jgi:uncharacterized protein YneF (UPF0154 family)
MWNWIIPIVTLLVGLVGGFAIGVFYLRNQMESMQNDPEMIRRMAKQMGYNLNQAQMNKMQNMMKRSNAKNKKKSGLLGGLLARFSSKK